jgi:hypothetical protein
LIQTALTLSQVLLAGRSGPSQVPIGH